MRTLFVRVYEVTTDDTKDEVSEVDKTSDTGVVIRDGKISKSAAIFMKVPESE